MEQNIIELIGQLAEQFAKDGGLEMSAAGGIAFLAIKLWSLSWVDSKLPQALKWSRIPHDAKFFVSSGVTFAVAAGIGLYTGMGVKATMIGAATIAMGIHKGVKMLTPAKVPLTDPAGARRTSLVVKLDPSKLPKKSN